MITLRRSPRTRLPRNPAATTSAARARLWVRRAEPELRARRYPTYRIVAGAGVGACNPLRQSTFLRCEAARGLARSVRFQDRSTRSPTASSRCLEFYSLLLCDAVYYEGHLGVHLGVVAGEQVVAEVVVGVAPHDVDVGCRRRLGVLELGQEAGALDAVVVRLARSVPPAQAK